MVGEEVASVPVASAVKPDEPALWLVLLGLFVYWVIILVRAILWRSVPWRLKIVS